MKSGEQCKHDVYKLTIGGYPNRMNNLPPRVFMGHKVYIVNYLIKLLLK